MKRYLLSLALLCLVATGAHAYWQSRAQVAIVTGGGFTGPGDINGAAVTWYGLRAFSSAKRGTKVANVCNSTGGVDVGCADMFSDATTGDLVPQTISSITCPGANCTVKILYDQSGSTSCAGSTACDVTNATVANRPTLTANAVGSLPGMTFSQPSAQKLVSSTAVTQAQTLSMSAVAKRTTVVSNDAIIAGDTNFTLLGFQSSGFAAMYAGGGFVPSAAAENTFHGLQALYAGAGSAINVDGGTSTTGSPGSGGLSAENIQIGGFNVNQMSGVILECGIWAGDKSANNTAMNSNQHAYWGF